MTFIAEEESLIAAIEESPLDDALMIYADWLRENERDPEAEYLCLVVEYCKSTLEDSARTALNALSESLISEWRERVASRFEVTLEGSWAILLAAHLFNAVLNLALGETIRQWETGQPLVIKTRMTLDGAERFARSFGLGLSATPAERDIRITVRPMAEPGLGLLQEAQVPSP